MKTLIITPACNEEKHLAALIDSMSNQSILPSCWLIVDDGSTDSTSNVIKQSTIKYSWIKYLRKEKTGTRSPGKSVMETFYFGFNHINNREYDVIFKLDADLVLPPNYIETIINEFQKNTKIGMVGGVCVIESNGQHILETETNLDHIRGALKAYRKECFQEIGGLVQKMGWDTVDEHYARFKGWKVSVLTDLEVLHQRSTHQEYGFLKAAFRNGKMLYSIRMDIFLVIANSIKKVFKFPYLLLGLFMCLGYVYAFLTRYERIVNKDLGKFIRKYRYKKIVQRFSN
ncbi:MAG: glycosyl transferase family 2 [Flavobacteriales bacterium]|nr:glycosyl transferase family 2 [Flavobacteriales bacterium]